MSGTPSRMPLIDALKAVASQLIVLHHLIIYGPLAVGTAQLFPETAEWLSDYGRMAVQVFLVIGGFLAARSLAPAEGSQPDNPLPLIARRYLRLAVPFVIAITLAIICSAIADHLMDDEAIPAAATLKQWLAHALLLHGVLGVESLSAGVWYVAIDFQLYALMAVLLWLGHRAFGGIGGRSLILGLAVASLFWFNRDSALDNWAIYFFGAYGLGAAAHWATEGANNAANDGASDCRQGGSWLGIVAAVTVIALIIDFRLRIGLALGIALLLGYSRHSRWPERWLNTRQLAFLGRISYSVFLIHFPVLLLANGLFVLSGSSAPEIAGLVLLATSASCTLAGWAFYCWVEKPAARLSWPAAINRTVQRVRGNIPAPRD